jgi:multiple sugar transport system substrate-binding protein
MIASGERIDILFNSIGQTAMTLLEYKLEYDITELIKTHKYDLSRLEPTSVEIQRQIADGGIYGLPVTTSTLALYYNKDLFDRFAVPYPKESMSWDELMELTKKLSRTDRDQSYMGLGLSSGHFMLLTPYSAPFVDPKTNRALFTSEAFSKSFKAMTSVFHIKGNELSKETMVYTNLLAEWEKQKRVAMFIGLSGLHSRFSDAGLNWDYAPFPYFSDMKGVGPQNYPNYFYITNVAKEKDEAFDVIAYLTSNEMQTYLSTKGLMPTVTDPAILDEFGKDAAFLKGKNGKAIIPTKFAEPAIKTKFQQVATGPVTNAFNQVVGGTKDINSALREAEEQANKAINGVLEISK